MRLGLAFTLRCLIARSLDAQSETPTAHATKASFYLSPTCRLHHPSSSEWTISMNRLSTRPRRWTRRFRTATSRIAESSEFASPSPRQARSHSSAGLPNNDLERLRRRVTRNRGPPLVPARRKGQGGDVQSENRT